MARPKFPTSRVRTQRARGTASYIAWLRSIDHRPKPKDKDSGGLPVEPDRPLNLSGGAAEALEYDD